MTDREKLIDLLKNASTEVETICDQSHCSECPGGMACDRGIMAEYLLANGVTFANDIDVGGKWIPVTERLPEETYQVLTVDDEEWVEIDALGGEGWMSYRNVTHWMPLPEPPKEE